MFCLLELRYVCILMYLTQITWIITNHIILPFCHFDVLPFCRFAILPFCQFYLVLPFWILPTILVSNLGKTKTINGQNVLPFKIEICLHPYIFDANHMDNNQLYYFAICYFDILLFCRFAILLFCQFYLVLPF